MKRSLRRTPEDWQKALRPLEERRYYDTAAKRIRIDVKPKEVKSKNVQMGATGVRKKHEINKDQIIDEKKQLINLKMEMEQMKSDRDKFKNEFETLKLEYQKLQLENEKNMEILVNSKMENENWRKERKKIDNEVENLKLENRKLQMENEQVKEILVNLKMENENGQNEHKKIENELELLKEKMKSKNENGQGQYIGGEDVTLGDSEVGAVGGGGEDETVGGGEDETVGGCEDGTVGSGEVGAVGVDEDEAVINEIVLPLDNENDVPLFDDHLGDENVMESHVQECAMVRARNMTEMTRLVTSKIISDRLLSTYSYSGQRKKKAFKIYTNITKLIVSSVVRNEILQLKNKTDIEIKTIKEQLEKEVQNYFQEKCFKYASNRLKD